MPFYSFQDDIYFRFLFNLLIFPRDYSSYAGFLNEKPLRLLKQNVLQVGVFPFTQP